MSTSMHCGLPLLYIGGISDDFVAAACQLCKDHARSVVSSMAVKIYLCSLLMPMYSCG